MLHPASGNRNSCVPGREIQPGAVAVRRRPSTEVGWSAKRRINYADAKGPGAKREHPRMECLVRRASAASAGSRDNSREVVSLARSARHLYVYRAWSCKVCRGGEGVQPGDPERLARRGKRRRPNGSLEPGILGCDLPQPVGASPRTSAV